MKQGLQQGFGSITFYLADPFPFLMDPYPTENVVKCRSGKFMNNASDIKIPLEDMLSQCAIEQGTNVFAMRIRIPCLKSLILQC